MTNSVHAIALQLAVFLTFAPARAADPPAGVAAWAATLQAYAADPVRNRRAMRDLQSEGVENLPPMMLLATADAELRSGNGRAARRLFEEVLARRPDEPFAGWAELGLGWVEVTARSRAAARRQFALVADAPSPSRAVATVLVAMLDADAGRTREAAAGFDAIAEDARVMPALRQAAALGGGYVRYWVADYPGARERFDRAASMLPGGTLADDARYGAAMARWRAGEEGAGLAALRALARLPGAGKPGEPVAASLLGRNHGAFVRVAAKRYRRLPFRLPEDQVTGLLDRDGPALARATLAHLREREEAPSDPGGQEVRRYPERRATTAGADSTTAPAVSKDTIAERKPVGTRLPWLLIALLCLVGVAGAAVIRRALARGERRQSRHLP